MYDISRLRVKEIPCEAMK